MINPQCLELPMSRTQFHGPIDVRAIEVRLYMKYIEILVRQDACQSGPSCSKPS